MTDPFGSGESPLGAADWSLYFKDPALGAKSQPGWYNGLASPIYGALGSAKNPYSYDPGGGGKQYDPYSTMSAQMIAGDIQNYMRWNESDWMAWTGTVNGNVGLVAQDPNFGQFSKHPEVYGEIQSAAQKYGVPANFLQAIIFRESSGDWDSNSGWINSVRGGKPILGYIGFFDDAAYRWLGAGTDLSYLNNNRAAQIDLLAKGMAGLYAEAQKANPAYGWTQVASMHFAGSWTDAGYVDELNNTTSGYVGDVVNSWKSLDALAGNTWSNVTVPNSGGTGGAIGSPSTSKWTMVNQWDSQVQAAIAKVAQETGVTVPANVVKAIMQIESGGDPNVGVSPAGYGGLMQTGPGSMGGPWSMSQLTDPAFAIYTGVKELALRYTDSGKMPWSNVIVGYFSGHYTPNGASDGYNSDYNYQTMFNANMNELNASGSGVYGGVPSGVQATPGTNYMAAIFGGTEHGVTQEFGPTEWSMGEGSWMYGYSLKLGFSVTSHPGLDLQAELGTTVYFPFAGTVEYVGSDNGFRDEITGGVGQIRVRLANGDSVIYGHMYSSNFQAGQTISAGQAIGTTGGMNGPHLHLEYRTPDSSLEGGERAIDPRGPFHGDFSGSYSGGGGVSGEIVKTGPGYTLPLTYHNILMGLMTGRTLPYGNNGTFGSASENPFRNHLLSIMNGTYNQNNTLSRAQALGYVGRNSVIGAANNAANGAGGPFSTTNVSNAKLTKTGEQIVSLAKGYLGTPYVWAGHTPSGWDCSGFVGWFYQQTLGIDIGYGSHYQYAMGQSVDKSQLQVGDLVFFDTAGGGEVDNGNTASHVGMYIGNGQIIHAANPSQGTIISSLNDPYYSGTYLGARRYA